MSAQQPLRIVEQPAACMSGGTPSYFDVDEAHRYTSTLLAGGPLDAPNHLPMGGAWNHEYLGVQLSYGSVLRQGALL